MQCKKIYLSFHGSLMEQNYDLLPRRKANTCNFFFFWCLKLTLHLKLLVRCWIKSSLSLVIWSCLHDCTIIVYIQHHSLVSTIMFVPYLDTGSDWYIRCSHGLALESGNLFTAMDQELPGFILNLTTFGCFTDINFIGCSVQCLCRSVAEISCKKRKYINVENQITARDNLLSDAKMDMNQ
jgi:hypothetical protein